MNENTTRSATAGTTRDERFAHGLEILRKIDGDAGQRVVDSLADVSPELGHQVVAWAFGDIYDRPGLAPRDRQLVTLGMLTALGGCEAQLDVHVNAALNVGLTAEQIMEALLHSAVYCGMPKALNATFAAKKVFAERGLLPVGGPAAEGAAAAAV
ncbi:carboxymuconolactone decarboxylase family protein [Streptomyces sp. NPDC047017]|uniref:carboxymuconolactone decarboxylase family protein n=1 Tax=Streptomyces sp. NPDC047017 TaxID=3155024 RepID=UPI0034029FDB